MQFMKVFLENTQAWDQEQLEPQKHSLKAIIPETYSKKSHIDCYYFCQQSKDHFKTLGAIGINDTFFAATFFRSSISFKWA